MFVRALTADEQAALEAGLRSPDAFVLRRCQILLASARGKRAPASEADLGCDQDTVLHALHAFSALGLEALHKRSSRPHISHVAFDGQGVERLRALLHQSPRHVGRATDLWTRPGPEESFGQGLMSRPIRAISIVF